MTFPVLLDGGVAQANDRTMAVRRSGVDWIYRMMRWIWFNHSCRHSGASRRSNAQSSPCSSIGVNVLWVESPTSSRPAGAEMVECVRNSRMSSTETQSSPRLPDCSSRVSWSRTSTYCHFVFFSKPIALLMPQSRSHTQCLLTRMRILGDVLSSGHCTT